MSAGSVGPGERRLTSWVRRAREIGQRSLASVGLAIALGLAAGAGALVLFAHLAGEVAERETEALDLAVLAALRSTATPTLDALAWGVSLLGSEVLALVLVVTLVGLAWRRRWAEAAGLATVVGGAQGLNDLLKDLFRRTRPPPSVLEVGGFSFPSGHAMVSAAFYLFLAYLAWRHLRGPARPVCVGALLLLVGLIGLSRMYLGVHYLTDVAAGYLAGFLWTDAVVVGARWLEARRRPASPRPAPASRHDLVT